MTVPKCRRERGVTVVEYALGVVFIVVAMIVGIEVVEDRSSERLEERAGTIGSPGDEALGSDTDESNSESGDDDGEVPPPPPPAPYTGEPVQGTCTGPSGDFNECPFSLSVDPGDLVPEWTVVPNADAVGVPATGDTVTITFTKKGSYSVRAQVGDTQTLLVITCTKSGPNISCN